MTRRLVSFDWAMKRLLRSKANFGILEGFFSELLNDDIKILEILEGESNRLYEREKYNRIDLKVKNQKGQIVLIEVQYQRELDFLHRILYGASKVLVEHLHKGQHYKDIVKVISISILYFDLGHGSDYIYHGTTRFTGIHNHDELELSESQRKEYGMNWPHQLYPEYYLIKINNFNDIAKTTLDEWIYFLKNEEIKDDFKAKGLSEAMTELDLMKMSDEERKIYDEFIEDRRYQVSMFDSSFGDGYNQGKEEGREEGREEGLKEGKEAGLKEGEEIGIAKGKEEGLKEGEKKAKIAIASELLASGMKLEDVARIAGLVPADLKQMLSGNET